MGLVRFGSSLRTRRGTKNEFQKPMKDKIANEDGVGAPGAASRASRRPSHAGIDASRILWPGPTAYAVRI